MKCDVRVTNKLKGKSSNENPVQTTVFSITVESILDVISRIIGSLYNVDEADSGKNELDIST